MTTMNDATGHPDPDELSALVESLLPEPRATWLRQHVSLCTDCGATLAALEEIRTLLGTFDAPRAMPADIADRLDEALAAEAEAAVLNATGAPVAAPVTADVENQPAEAAVQAEVDAVRVDVSRETSTPTPPRSRPDRPDRPAGRPRAGTGPGRASRPRAGRRRQLTLGTLFTAAVIGLCSLLLQSLDDDGRDVGAKASSTASPPGDRQTFSSQELELQVSTLLSSQPSLVDAGPSLDSGPRDSAPSLDMASPENGSAGRPLKSDEPTVPVPECVRDGIGRPEAPLAAERGTFEGIDAYLVVLPDATQRSQVSAYIVDASCTREGFPHPGRILLADTFARG